MLTILKTAGRRARRAARRRRPLANENIPCDLPMRSMHHVSCLMPAFAKLRGRWGFGVEVPESGCSDICSAAGVRRSETPYTTASRKLFPPDDHQQGESVAFRMPRVPIF